LIFLRLDDDDPLALPNAQSGASGTHLHFKVPSGGFLTHAETLQGIASNRAKWAHIAEFYAIKEMQKESGQPAGKNLRQIHATWFPLTADTGADNKIGNTGRDWCNESSHQFRAIAAIAVEKNENFRARVDRSHARSTGRP
jgi:hypothetical protein